MLSSEHANLDRKTWMGLLARSPRARLADLFAAALPRRPGFAWLRAPEVGAVMVQARAGGRGAPFNLGEMTVTRCALQLDGGPVGHAYVQGRDKQHAERAALVDALMQSGDSDRIRAEILSPLAAEMQATRASRAKKAAATRVEFFTVARGED